MGRSDWYAVWTASVDPEGAARRDVVMVCRAVECSCVTAVWNEDRWSGVGGLLIIIRGCDGAGRGGGSTLGAMMWSADERRWMVRGVWSERTVLGDVDAWVEALKHGVVPSMWSMRLVTVPHSDRKVGCDGVVRSRLWSLCLPAKRRISRSCGEHVSVERWWSMRVAFRSPMTMTGSVGWRSMKLDACCNIDVVVCMSEVGR